MEEQAVRWNIKVSKDTDLTLRTFLGSQGMKKCDLSKFIEDAVRWRVLQCTIQDIRSATPAPTRTRSSASSTKP
jgi:Ribbon-helix-helix domain